MLINNKNDILLTTLTTIDNNFSSIWEKILMIVATLIVDFFDLVTSYTVTHGYMLVSFERAEIVDRLSLPHDWMENIHSR